MRNIDNEIEEAVKVIKKGGVVVFPTETVYGIGASALNKDSIKRLYDIKNRPANKKISILVSSLEMLKQVTKNISDIEYKLVKAFFPGPLTLVLHKNECIPDILTNYEDVVGFRMPANDIALKIIEGVGGPVATSSANFSGEPSGTDIEGIRDKFKNSVDFYVDGGKSKLGIGSTVVQIIDGVPQIIREGSITEEQIMKVIEK